MSDIIDINVGETIEEVTINVVDNLITVNINKVTGGGGSQTLAETLDLGNTTGGENISISNGDAIILDNGSMLKKGTIDAGNGGAKGISQICGVGYEHKWEAGRLYIMNDGGTIIREVSHNLTYTPTATDDVTKGFVQNTRWILDNGDVYVCTDPTEGAAVWEFVTGVVPTLQQVTTEGNQTNNPIKVIDDGNSLTELRYNGLYFEDLVDNGTTILRFLQTSASDQQIEIRGEGGTMALLSDIPSSSTFVPYTGATTNVDLGTHSITAKDLIVTHSSGSGDAATITKGGSGEALKVSKTSGSGNAASITGGVTLLDELHLNTDLADSYIASASVWNAKQNAVAGVSDTEIGYLDGVTSAIQTQLNARCQSLYNLTSQITHTGTTAKTLLLTYFIPANTFTNGDFLIFSALVTKAANIGSTTHTIETNTTNTLTGATIISTAGFNTTNFSMKFKREIALTGGNGYVLNISNNTQNDQTINGLPNAMPSFTYNLAADLYLFVTCQLSNATDSITYRGVSITKN